MTPVFYEGIMWCIRVASGAFVARRNGKAFITGNSGFPKSLDVSKAIDKAAGVEREITGRAKGAATNNTTSLGVFAPEYDNTAPATDAAKQWDGWGTALKPAVELITLARVPFPGTVADNVLEYGTGAINVDGCRVGLDGERQPTGNAKGGNSIYGQVAASKGLKDRNITPVTGRWPANLIHDGSEEVTRGFPETGPSSDRPQHNTNEKQFNTYGVYGSSVTKGHTDNGGSAARFFYVPKADKNDRGEGNDHPTVKPLDLMKYLVRLVTPPGGIVLDPFMGSGATIEAAYRQGFRAIGIELEEKHCETAVRRLAQRELFTP